MGTKNDPGAFDCYENADPDEPMFVLLARDPLAPGIVEAWADAYRRTHPGTPGQEAKFNEALVCAHAMRQWRTAHPAPKEGPA